MRHVLAIFGLFVASCAIAAEDVDVIKTIERIKEDAARAGEQLNEKNPGARTQQLQKDVLQRIDDLIRQVKKPPPMNDGSSSSNSSPMKKNGGESSAAAQRRERRQKESQAKNGGSQPKEQGNATSQRTETPSGLGSIRPLTEGKTDSLRPTMPLRVSDTYKDVWGHLPEKVRQEMDLYFRDQFMPRYSELLRQYYSSLAERNPGSEP